MRLFLRFELFLCLVFSRVLPAVSQSVTTAPVEHSLAGTSSTEVSVNTDSMRQANIKKYYSLGLQYKDGDGVPMDYTKAFYNFSQAAALGDEQSIYAVGYLHYKGLGTTQDYTTAAQLFAQGAYLGKDNSMYFYGLSWRNGYGVEQNEDSAQYWLKKAAALGYKQAIQELQMKGPESSNAAAEQLIENIHNAALPDKIPLNQFVVIQPQVPDSGIIAGDYEGYVIQYDWSGQKVINAQKLQLSVSPDSSKAGYLIGKWKEVDMDTASVIHASLQRDSLVFANTHYGRKDHYSPDRAITYDFKNAALNLVRKDDSIYLAGNIYMFSPDRKEPSKPLFVALVRTSATATGKDSSAIKKQVNQNLNDSMNQVAVKLLDVYPNPFHSYVNIKFLVKKATSVGIELYNMAGQMVYAKQPQFLNAGQYIIRIEPSSMLPAQTYFLRLNFAGNEQQAVKIIKK